MAGPVNEGSTGTVSFASVTGGTGPYTYSYDFNNDGTFEITGSTQATATVPAQYLANPGSVTVHGRVTDSTGAFVNYTTTITVNNVAPAVTPGGAGQTAVQGVSTSSPSARSPTPERMTVRGQSPSTGAITPPGNSRP